LATDEQGKTISEILLKIIQKIDFGLDLEQQFKILVNARSDFINFDSITIELVK